MNLIKKILRWTGLRLLKWSGWDVPDTVLKRMVTPIVLQSKFVVASDAHAFVQDTVVSNRKQRVLRAAEKYVHIDVVDKKNNQRVVTATLICQSEDPPSSKN